MELEAENCVLAKSNRRRSKRYSGCFNTKHAAKVEIIRSPLADVPNISNKVSDTEIDETERSLTISDNKNSQYQVCPAKSEGVQLLEVQVETKVDNIKAFDEYMLGVIGEDMMTMVRNDVLSKADPENSFKMLEMLVMQYLTREEPSQLQSNEGSEPPAVKKRRRSSMRRRTADREIVESASLIVSPPTPTHASPKSSNLRINPRRRSKRIRKSLAVYREQGTLPSQISHASSSSKEENNDVQRHGEAGQTRKESDLEQLRTATPTSTDIDLDGSSISIISEISHVSGTSYPSEDLQVPNSNNTKIYDDISYTESIITNTDDSRSQNTSEFNEDLDATYRCDSQSSPADLETAMLLESSISLNGTFTIDIESCQTPPICDTTFEKDGPSSPVLTAALEQLYRNQNFSMPDPQPLSTIFEQPRKWRGVQIIFSKGGQYRQFNFTEGCWYRVEASKVNQRKKKAKKNGWKPKSDYESARYEVHLENALEKLDISLQEGTPT